MRRRLFQSFEQRVKRTRRQHVHLVDDIHAVFRGGGGEVHFLPQLADAVDAVV